MFRTQDLVINALPKEHAGRQIPLLRLFGLDEQVPGDRIDVAHVFRPGSDLDGFGSTALRGTYIVFPTLEPFGRPPPVPSEGLSGAESAAVLGTDANPAIYDEPDPVIRGGATRFRLNFRYRARLEGQLSSFNLGAFGIRDGSERITVEDRLLTRGIDYVVDYDLGLVTLLESEPDLQVVGEDGKPKAPGELGDVVAKLLEYLRLREESFRHRIAALRTGDEAEQRQFLEKQQAASALARRF